MITPEYVDRLIDEVKRRKLPVASAELGRERISYDAVRYTWIIEKCPLCGERHVIFAGYDFDEVHRYLKAEWCGAARRYFVMMRDYDINRDRDKLPEWAFETAEDKDPENVSW